MASGGDANQAQERKNLKHQQGGWPVALVTPSRYRIDTFGGSGDSGDHVHAD
jgi:hypothetical protein